MLSLFLIGCFQIDGEEWTDWENTHSPNMNVQDALPYFSQDAEISPSVEVYTGTELTCIAEALDFNEEVLTPAYTWKIGDDEMEITENLFTPTRENSDVDDVVTCIVSVTDSNGKMETSEATVTIKNTDPVVTEPEIDANEFVYNDDVLTCSATASDADEDVSVSYSWEQGGVQFHEGDSVNLDDFTIEPNQTISCVASVEDSNEGSDSKTASVTITNRNPTISNIEVSNELPEMGDTITCSATESDEDNDEVTISFAWEAHGIIIDNDATLEISDTDFSVGDEAICVITATDEFDGQTIEHAPVTVQNTLPTIGATTISPSTGVNSVSFLTCLASGLDANDGALTPTYEWTNGTTFAPIGSTNTIQLGTHLVSPNDTVTCSATVEDSHGATAFSEASVLVNNAPPVFSAPAEVYPNTGIYTGTTLGCLGSASDPEDGSAFLTYTWQVNGLNQVGTNQSYTIDANQTNVGDTLTCTITAMDGTGATTTSFSSVIIENSAPTMTGINLTTVMPEADGSVTAFPNATDADGDNLSYSYSWMLGSIPLGNASSQTFDPSYIGPGDMAELTVTVSDGNGGSDSMSTSVVIANTPPEITLSASISPAPANTGSLVVCTAEGEDLNDGSLTPSYSWTNVTTGAVIGGGNMLQLDSSKALPNDIVRCTATVTDSDGGTDSSIAVVTIENAPPIFLQTAEITPSTVYSGMELTCSAEAFDSEQGALSPNFFWKINGIQTATGTTFTIDNTQTDVGDSISCTVEATDSYGETATSIVSVTIQNSAPEIHTVAIIPSGFGLYNDEPASCGVMAQEADGEAMSYSYVWSSDGVELGYSYALDLSTTALMPGDTLTCTAQVADPTGDFGEDSASLVVDNRAPSEPTISISWTAQGYYPIDSDDLVCSAQTTDPDGEAVSFTYAWSSDAGGSVSGDTVQSAQTAAGEIWTCTATSSDGVLTTDGTNSATISDQYCSLTDCDSGLDLGNFQGLDMNLIPAGTNIEEDYILSSAFYMMTTEVTQGQFNQLMGYQAYDGMTTSDSTGSFGVGDNYPAYHVNWHMAADFANLATQLYNSTNGTSLNECYACSNSGTASVACTTTMEPYSCDGYRLPTVAEQIYSARSETRGTIWIENLLGTMIGYNFSCTGDVAIEYNGNALSGLYLGDYAWYCGNNNQEGHPYGSKEVAQLIPNGWGLYDMHGNLREWSADYGTSFGTNTGFLTGTDPYQDQETPSQYTLARSLYGDDWSSGSQEVWNYSSFQFYGRTPYLGFRLARGQ